MAKQWDSFIKLLAEENKQDLVTFLLPGAIFEKELNNEMQSRVLEADLKNGRHHTVVDEMIAGKSNLLSLAYNFASLVFKSEKDRDWLRKRFTMLSGDMLEDSWAYQEMTAEARQKGIEKGLREGELRARRDAVLDIVQERFSPLGTLVSSHIQNIDDTNLLRRLIVKLSAAQTVQEAEQTFRSLVKDAQQH